MQELEKQAYIYSVEAIGFAKSLEKETNPGEGIEEFKKKSGKIYKLVADTHKAESNTGFADLLRETKALAPELKQKLHKIHTEDKALQEQKKQLTSKLDDIIQRLDEILSKIIY
jgi:predicted nuclease with TOPRIM domain